MKDWNTEIEPLVNKGLRIIGIILIILEVVTFSIVGYILYSYDAKYPLPYVPAWTLPVALASIIIKTTLISWLIFGKWDLKRKSSD
jgi:hypothetical protein